MTQTGPISYKAKMEEIKDGIKGAPTPSMLFYGFERFLMDPPYGKEKEVVYELKYNTIGFGDQEEDLISEDEDAGAYWWQQGESQSSEDEEPGESDENQ